MGISWVMTTEPPLKLVVMKPRGPAVRTEPYGLRNGRSLHRLRAEAQPPIRREPGRIPFDPKQVVSLEASPRGAGAASVDLKGPLSGLLLARAKRWAQEQISTRGMAPRVA
jgi:hypothetical protein